MSRYLELLKLIDQHKPRTIVEIGVWNGANAIRMINQAKQYHDDVEYTGYDLFEDATSESDIKEFNVKSHNQVKAVAAYIRAETGIIPTLIKGDTNETLKPTEADFVFLDGGHSVKTIEKDFKKVCLSKVVALDDYYVPDENGNMPDVSRYGCNSLVQKMGDIGYRILPTKDFVKNGGYTQLVVTVKYQGGGCTCESTA